MGMMALGAAIAGAGKGAVANATFERQMEMLQKESDMSQAREEAITRLQGSLASQRQEKEIGAQKELQGSQQAFELERQARELVAAGHINQAKLLFEQNQGTLNRQSRERIAQILGQSRVTAAGERAAATGGRNVKQRFTFGRYDIPGAPIDPTKPVLGMKPKQTINVVRDNQNQKEYADIGGDRFVEMPAGATSIPNPSSSRRPAASDINYLMEHPETAPRFEKYYGSLPGAYFRQQPLQPNAQGNPSWVPKGATYSEGQSAGPEMEPSEGAEDQEDTAMTGVGATGGEEGQETPEE